MQLLSSTFISYAGVPVKEAWYEGTLVWQASSFGWTLSNLAQGTWTDVEYCNNGTLIAVGNNRYSYSIDNGTTWATPILNINPDTGTELYNALTCGPDNMWVIFESRAYSPYGSNKFYTTFNPVTGLASYTLSDPISTVQFTDAIYSSHHAKYIAAGTKDTRYTNNLVGAYSTDGVNWLSANMLNYNGTLLIDNGGIDGGITEGTNMPNHRLVGCSGSPNYKLCYSDNGITWRQGAFLATNTPLGQNLQTNCNWKDVAYGVNSSLPLSGRYVAINNNGSTSQFPFAYSDNGIDWYGVSSTGAAINKNWSSIVYGNGRFIAADTNRYQAISKDGINWAVYQNLPTNDVITDICVANNRFVSLIYNSLDGGAAYAEFVF